MTRAQQIERLEALLGRILARARAQPAAPVAAAQPVAPATEVDAEVEWPTRPPPPPPEPETASQDGARTKVADVDESAHEEPHVEHAARSGNAPFEGSSDSRERLVAAPQASPSSVAPEPAAEGCADAVALADASPVEIAPGRRAPPTEEPSATLESEPPGEVEPEQPPASSRRPVMPEPEEQIARIAFGNDAEPPRHTPPPESGQLPTAAESDLEPNLGSSSVMEGFGTGIDVSALDATTGVVRPPAPRLVVLETRAALPGDVEVAEMTDGRPSRRPETFVQLLRASLSL